MLAMIKAGTALLNNYLIEMGKAVPNIYRFACRFQYSRLRNDMELP